MFIELGRGEAVFAQHLVDPRLDDDPRPAGNVRLRRDAETREQRGGLGQISHLPRTAEVGERRKQGRLDHRAEQHIGRQSLGRFGRDFLELPPGKALAAAARDEAAAILAQAVAAQPPFDQDRRQTVGERFVQRQKQPGCGSPFRGAVVRPKDSEPFSASAEQPIQRFGPSVGQVHLWPVARRQPLPNVGLALRIGQRGIQCVERRADIRSQRLAKQRQLRRVVRALAQSDLDRLAVPPQYPGVVGFREIVIISRDPEHGDDRDAALPLDPIRQCDRRQRLVHGVQRACEQSRLLPGRNGQHFAVGEPVSARSREHRGERIRVDAAGCAGRKRSRRHGDWG